VRFRSTVGSTLVCVHFSIRAVKRGFRKVHSHGNPNSAARSAFTVAALSPTCRNAVAIWPVVIYSLAIGDGERNPDGSPEQVP
jgi:hypothetical protein